MKTKKKTSHDQTDIQTVLVGYTKTNYCKVTVGLETQVYLSSSRAII